MQFTKETPTTKFIIQDNAFDIPLPFNEGHSCTSAEAGVLNQTLAENVRNNLAARVKKHVEEGTFEQAAMQNEVDQYLEEYEFGVRRGRGPVDPIEREALNMAKEIVKDALRKSGHKLADIETSDINNLAAQVVEENPDVRKAATARVKERQKIGEIKLPDLKSSASEADSAPA